MNKFALLTLFAALALPPASLAEEADVSPVGKTRDEWRDF